MILACFMNGLTASGDLFVVLILILNIDSLTCFSYIMNSNDTTYFDIPQAAMPRHPSV